MDEQLALFPLNTVLFPTMPLPLHIFEDRYKNMINQCIDTNTPFGVVLIKSGKEVGGSAKPHNVGTVAQIKRVENVAEGRMNLLVIGERRFRITEITQEQPILTADVEFLEPEETDPSELPNKIAEIRGLFWRYLNLILTEAPSSEAEKSIPTTPDSLTFMVASSLQIALSEKQLLLETFNCEEIMDKEITMLTNLIQELTKQEKWNDFVSKIAEKRRPPGKEYRHN